MDELRHSPCPPPPKKIEGSERRNGFGRWAKVTEKRKTINVVR